jgi:hypothetical protein
MVFGRLFSVVKPIVYDGEFVVGVCKLPRYTVVYSCTGQGLPDLIMKLLPVCVTHDCLLVPADLLDFSSSTCRSRRHFTGSISTTYTRRIEPLSFIADAWHRSCQQSTCSSSDFHGKQRLQS